MTRRRLVVGFVLLAILAVAASLLWLQGNAKSSDVIVSGDVRVVEQVVTAPAIAQPSPDVAVGISATPTAGASRTRAAGGQSVPSASRTPTVSGFLAEMLVAQGDRVKKGQIVAKLETTMLDLGVAQAASAARKAGADVAVLDSNLDKLDDARAKLITGRAKLITARAKLVTTQSKLLKQRAGLVAKIAVIEKLIAMPGGPPPNNPPYPVLLAGMKAGAAGMDKGLAGIRTGLAKMSQALAKMSQALAKMRTGLAQIDSARTKLRDLRGVLVVQVASRDVALRAAKTRLGQATIVAPVDGVVLYARPAGTVVMVGAPLVRLRPDGPSQIQTYLTAEQLASVRPGTPVSVTYDSASGTSLTGVVTTIGDESRFPPTSFATTIVHMTRAVRVTITLDEGKVAPPGTPVDIVVRTGQSR